MLKVVFMISMMIFVTYFNLGKLLDATIEPMKTDLLVCLGGGDYKIRIEKTLELYDEGLLNSNTIILTGYVNSKREVQKGIVKDKRVTFIKDNNYKDLNIVLNKNPKNTAEEVKYIKKYMIKHNFKSVTFITEAPHSRRILVFSKIISIDGDRSLSMNVVGAEYKNWDSSKYYEDKYARYYAFSETIKIFYGVFMYGVLDKLGLLEWFEEEFRQDIEVNRKRITRGMNFISL